MTAHRSRAFSRLVAAIMVTVAFGGALVALAACGDGATPAPPMRTLTPSASEGTGKRDSTTTPTVAPSATPSGTSSAKASPTPSASPSRITDKAIKAGILARIAQEPGLKGFDIRVAVTDGAVYLRGRVRTKAQRRSIEQIALSEPGVTKVVSAIDVDDAAGY
jgi:hypothetical protein